MVASTGCASADLIDIGVMPTGSDTTARFFHRAGLLPDGTVLVSGGMALQIFPPSLISLGDLSFYDAGAGSFTTTWTPLGGGDPVTPTLATPRSSHTQTRLDDGRVLFTGGNVGASGTSPGTPTLSVELFDPQTGVMSAGPDLNVARAFHSATRLDDGRVVVAGGSTWQVFDAGLDEWSAAFRLQRSRTAHAAVLLDAGDVLLVGGAGSGPSTLERLDPDAGTSDLLTVDLGVGLDDLGAVRLDGGDVLIVGGQNTSTGDTVNLAWRYEPDSDTLTSLPAPGVADGIADHSMTRLGSRVIVTGGESQVSGEDTELDVLLVFDPGTGPNGDWIYSGSTGSPHDDAAAVAFNAGVVLIIDGGVPFLGQEAPSSTVELFTVTFAGPGDVNCDGGVDVQDLLAVLSAWGPCVCDADVNDDGVVNVADLLIVLQEWG